MASNQDGHHPHLVEGGGLVEGVAGDGEEDVEEGVVAAEGEEDEVEAVDHAAVIPGGGGGGHCAHLPPLELMAVYITWFQSSPVSTCAKVRQVQVQAGAPR